MKNKYSIEYFLKDPEFIKRVKEFDGNLSALRNSFAVQHLEGKEEMLKAAEIILSLKIKSDYSDKKFKEEALDNILVRIDAESKRPHVKNRFIFKSLLRYAGVFLILLGIGFTAYQLLYNSKTDIGIINSNSGGFVKEVPIGTKLQTQLPDGSYVWINSGSKLEYYEDSLSNSRIITLSGEAFFDVVKDPVKPFIVTTAHMSLAVLGTSFNVVTYENGTGSEITLLTGKVVISKIKGEVSSIELQPGEKAIIDHIKGECIKQKMDYLRDIGWRDGILILKRASFDDVREKLEKWYGVKIHVSDESAFGDWEVDGQFENKSLEMTLEHLSYTKEFEFYILGKKVFITKKQ